MIYTDSYNREWEVIDFVLSPRGDNKQRVALENPDALGRAFRRDNDVLVYWFVSVSYRDTSERTLKEQFRYARRFDMNREREFWDRSPPSK